MPNIVFNPWVKIVNKLRKSDGTLCDYSSPESQNKGHWHIPGWVKKVFIGQSLLQPSTNKYTPNTSRIDLLNKSFTHFPQDLLINLKDEN
jgi:hypothetical protein